MEQSAEFIRLCPSCSTSVGSSTNFCPSCGFSLIRGQRLEYAGAWSRFFAALIDSLIVLIPDLIIFAGGSFNFVTAYLVAAGLAFVYHVGFWSITGATPGKMAFRLKVVLKDGSPVTAGAAVVRYIGYLINSFTLGLGYFLILFNDEKRGLHDYIAGTAVIVSR